MKEECLSKVILFGERSLRRALSEYVEYFHAERNHPSGGSVNGGGASDEFFDLTGARKVCDAYDEACKAKRAWRCSRV